MVIAASTGGPQGVLQICSGIKNCVKNIPVFIVLHMPDGFASIVASQLQRVTGLPAQPSSDGVAVQPGHIYVAKSGIHMALEKKGLKTFLHQENQDAINYCKSSADVLFNSAARIYRSGLVAVVLSGMGIDGLQGCRAISAEGGKIFVQDEGTSAVWGMPGAVARSEVPCQILPPDEIASKLQLLLDRRELVSA